MAAKKLYSFPLVVELTQTDFGVRNNNLSFRDSDFKVYKSVATPVEFIVRDNDRRPVSLVGRSVTLTVLNFFTGEPIIQKEADIIDAKKGRFRVIFLCSDVAEWEPCYFKYSVIIDYCGDCNTFLYVDQDHNAAGYFEFIDGLLPEPTQSYKILGSQFMPTNETPPTTGLTNYVSGGFPGDAIFSEDDGLHTVAVYANNFAGKFYVQGSLEGSPGTEDSDWFDIFLTGFTPYFEFGNTPTADSTYTGLEAFNFTASVRWVRFKYIPDADNPGQIVKVLYRN